MTKLAVTKRLLTGNHAKGRSGMAPDMVVIHVTEGNAASVRDWFANPAAMVSAHYMVCVNGVIDQFVDEADTAWHAGRVDHPTASLVLSRPTLNPNSFSIGIEHEGTGKEPLRPAQLAASLSLVSDICERHDIPIDRTHIVGHHEIYAPKTCPGAIDVDAYVRALRAVAMPTTRPPRPLIVWSEFARDWLIVTKVASDTEWEFVSLSAARRGSVTRATTPLSAMPMVAR